MATRWYCQLMAQEVGPLSAAELLKMVRVGEVTPDTPIRKDDSQWVPAREVNGLFESAARSQAHICPFCGHTVAKPPTTCSHCNRRLEAAYSGATSAAVPNKGGGPEQSSAATAEAAPRQAVRSAAQPATVAAAGGVWQRAADWLRSWFS